MIPSFCRIEILTIVEQMFPSGSNGLRVNAINCFLVETIWLRPIIPSNSNNSEPNTSFCYFQHLKHKLNLIFGNPQINQTN